MHFLIITVSIDSGIDMLHCEKFSTSRQTAYDNISNIDAAFSNMDDLRRIKYFLNLQCPDECISLCCSFVSNIYKESTYF